jgi:hypothetical protein
MTKLEKVLYTAKAHTTGDRGGGASRTDDGQSAIFLSVIKLAAGPTPFLDGSPRDGRRSARADFLFGCVG